MPREKIFFDLFNKSAANVHEAAKALSDLLENCTDVQSKAARLNNLEHAGDEIAHLIFDHLAKTFVPPLDREDIHDITTRLDDIIDKIDTAGDRLVLYKITRPTEEAKSLSRVLVKATGSLAAAFALLDNLKRSDEILLHCIDVNTQENEGDRIYHHALADLFEDGSSAVDIIKWKDIYHIIETATDACEDVTHTIKGIVVKNT